MYTVKENYFASLGDAVSLHQEVTVISLFLIGVPLEVFININVNDISSISEVKMVSLLWLFDPLSF